MFNSFRIIIVILVLLANSLVEREVQKTAHVFNVLECLKRDRTPPTKSYCSCMTNNADELQKLRSRFIELKTTLDSRIKENDDSLRRIVNLNYYIDQLLARAKRHFIARRT